MPATMVHVVEAMPSALVAAAGDPTLPAPLATAKLTPAPPTTLPYASVTRTDGATVPAAVPRVVPSAAV